MKLQDYLKKEDIGVREFGILAGIDGGTVSRIARGSAPTAKTAAKIIRATKHKVTLADLVNGEA